MRNESATKEAAEYKGRLQLLKGQNSELRLIAELAERGMARGKRNSKIQMPSSRPVYYYCGKKEENGWIVFETTHPFSEANC